MASGGVYSTPDSFTVCFMRAHQHLDAGVALKLRETHPKHANEMASHINKIYALLIEVQDDTEPVFTGNDLIAYDTTKGLAKASGISSLGLVSPVEIGVNDRLAPLPPEQSKGPIPTPAANVAAGSQGQPQILTEVSDLPEQRPPIVRLFGHDSQEVQALPMTAIPQITSLNTSIPAPQSWASVTANGIEAKTIQQAARITLSQLTGMPGAVLSSLPLTAERALETRVVWIYNCPRRIKLTDITELIHEGPVKSISFNSDPKAATARVVHIVFYLARDAALFLESAKTFTHPTWVRDLRFEAGEPHPDDNVLRLMDPPVNARRRLTVVRSGLFGGHMAESAFYQEILRVVPRSAVELIFYYNRGNATVVLGSVANAMDLKNHFDDQAKIGSSTFGGVQANFSKDPCEHAMRLVSDKMRDRHWQQAKKEGLVKCGSRTASRGGKGSKN
ncbi:hypothetical protein FGG08_002134 [Glutinoglossum americanum]|uniref:Uncharacterized protein n=1 Tax=Glutinoglossum americanum TaxID=1670608 RepID=A0A9P8I5C9_9PEZI|nr:hypothetical protein FGG08_002134 [Glutinoglossum americanum]